jgi:hypothetical protein
MFRRLILSPSSLIDVVCRVRKLLFVCYYGANTAYGYDIRQTLMMDLETVSEKLDTISTLTHLNRPRIFQCMQST